MKISFTKRPEDGLSEVDDLHCIILESPRCEELAREEGIPLDKAAGQLLERMLAGEEIWLGKRGQEQCTR